MKTDLCIRLAQEAGIPVRSPLDAERRSAMAILEIPAADRMAAYLKQKHIYTDSRKGRYLRLAPFVWNTKDEVERAMHAVIAGIRTRAYLSCEEAGTAAGPVT